ncbi:MAG: ABC transporter permease [Gammaproteobacteria bacterium]|nr:ABC transporter permease [Gammaproteobacteria bacterium]
MSLSIARLVVIEAVRTRLVLLALAAIFVAGAAGMFAGAIAITDQHMIRVATFAALLRIGGIAVVALFVISSQVREFTDNSINLALSRPVSRAHYYAGRLAGVAIVVGAWALLGLVLLSLAVPVPVALVWAASLFCEMLIVASFALACALALQQVPTAVLATAAFYLLARTMGAIQLLNAEPLTQGTGTGRQVADFAVRVIALALPDLERMTVSSWLVGSISDLATLLPLLVQTAIYVPLLAALGLTDLYRKVL